MYNMIPQKLKNKYNLPKRDKGIDLLWIHKEDDPYAIQSKYRKQTKTHVLFGELSTFLAQTSVVSKNIGKGILVTNTNVICDEIKDSHNYSTIHSIFFKRLQSEFFKVIRCSLKKKPVKYLPYSPKSYQVCVIKNVITHFKEKERATINMAYGTGKSIVSYFIWEKLKSKKKQLSQFHHFIFFHNVS
jgi:predicted helicase